MDLKCVFLIFKSKSLDFCAILSRFQLFYSQNRGVFISFFNIITYFIIKIKRNRSQERALNRGPDRINWVSALIIFPLVLIWTRSATQEVRYEQLKFCQLHGSGVGYMPNEIRNMSQWWFENKIGLECQTFGKTRSHMKVGQIEQKFCICFRSVKLGPSRPRPARHYTTFPSGCQQAIYTKISFDFW